jgi:uncharacterized protein YcbK (DUF882 family)
MARDKTDKPNPRRQLLSRRQVLVTGASLVLALPATRAVAALAGAGAATGEKTAAAADDDQRRLRLYHTHTGEETDLVYWRNDTYDPDALDRLDHILRDHRSGEVHEIDRELLDLVVELAARVDNPDGVFEIISGYRSPHTNEELRQAGGGVARRSQHMLGKAIDLRLRGTDTKSLQEAALAMQRGGVGYYRDSNFVHVDTGRVRRW